MSWLACISLLSFGIFLGVNLGFMAGAWWATRRRGPSIEEQLRDADRRCAELEREHPELGPWTRDFWSGKIK